MNGGGGRPCHPSRQVRRRTVSDGRRGLVHGAADYQTWNDRPAPRPGPRTGSPPGPRSRVTEEPGEAPVPAPRQRWRLVLARDASAPELAGRELGDAWDAAIAATGLPVYRPAGRNRPAIAFGAPVPVRMVLEGELADLVLTAMLPTWAVREALIGNVPPGWHLIGLFDVWLGAPALAGQVAAADYRIEIDGR